MTGRRASTAGATAAHARQYAVAVLLVVLSLLTVVGPHLHQVTAETASPGIVCRDARDCATPPQPQQDRQPHTLTLVARRADQQPRGEAAAPQPVGPAADDTTVTGPGTQRFLPTAEAALRSQEPRRAPGLRAPPAA